MPFNVEYMIAYAATHGYCTASRGASLQELVEKLWPQMRDPIYVTLDIFKTAARDVLLELKDREKSQVLGNDECAALLCKARYASSS
jgi:hypothetical protein